MAEKKNPPSNISDLKRSVYLQSKGIKSDAPLQLDLLFDAVFKNDKNRFIPNDYARSALFSARNKTAPRTTFQGHNLFHLHEGQGVSIAYTGIELRAEDDELVWLQIMHYAKTVPLGEPFDFSIKDLVRDIGWPKNGQYYDKARECISRLKANEVFLRNNKAYGESGAISLIDKYLVVNDQRGKPSAYRVWIHANMILLFAGNTFTAHNWEVYRKLSPVARRLADYIESHKTPFPLSLLKFREMCSSNDQSTTSWRQTVRRACLEVVTHGIANFAELESDQIHILRQESLKHDKP